MKLSTKYIGGMGDDLTGSSTLFKISGKDSLSVVIDYGLHQGSATDNELNNMTDEEVLNSDFVIITHAHMDHIGRLPMLIGQGFEGRIIMTSTTKDLASLMLINNVTLTTDQIKQVDDVNKKKVNKLRGYLRLLAINKKLEKNNLEKGEKWRLEKEKNKLLNGGDIKKLLKESIDFLQGVNPDIDIAKLLTKNQASNLLDIEDRIIEILESREERIDTNKLEFDNFLNKIIDLNRKIDNGDTNEITLLELEKNKYLLSLYPIEIKNKLNQKVGISKSHSQEKKDLLLSQQNILKEVSLTYNVNYSKTKISRYKKEKDEMVLLEKKRDHIVGDKDLELCIKYSKKILGKENDFVELISDLPTLLYDIQTVYKTLEKIETLEVGNEMTLERRMVIDNIDSEVICRIPQIIKDGYSKKIYINHKIITLVIAKWNKKYNFVVEYNKRNKELRLKYEIANKFIYNYERSKNKSKLNIPNGKIADEYYKEQVEILNNSEIYKLKKDLNNVFDIYTMYLSKNGKYDFVKDKSIEYFDELNSKLNIDISNLEVIKIGGNEYLVSDLLRFYNEYKDLICDYEEYLKIEEEFNDLNISSSIDIENISILKRIDLKKFISKVSFSIDDSKYDICIDEEYINKLGLLDIDKLFSSKQIIIIKKSLKNIFTRKIRSLLKEREVQIKNDKKEKEKLLSDFEKYTFFQTNKDFLNKIFIGKDNKLKDLLNLEKELVLLEKKKKEYSIKKELFSEYSDFKEGEVFFKSQKAKLDKYNILEYSDIDKILAEKYGAIKLPYTKKEIDSAKSRLEPTFEKSNQRTIEKITLKFFNAGHVEGSVMVSISVVTKKVENILNNIPHKVNERGFNKINKSTKEYINFLFTGDMGKFKDPNLSGTPDVPDLKYDYVQFESTYATRNHPDKKKEFTKFITELNTDYGNKLIPAFSFQRTQEISVELLQNKFDNIDLLEKYPTLKKELKKLNKDFSYILNTDFEDLNEEEKKLKTEKFIKKSKIENELLDIEKKVFLGTIILDAPLAVKIGEVFLKNFPEKYKFLDPEYQKAVFGRVIIKVLKQGEYKNLYKDSNSKGRYIILSSGGMMQGGAIINHAKEIVNDKNSKILFTGYQAANTLGGKIIRGEKNVIIDGDSYDVKSKIVSIGGYSSHIDKDDIIDFISKLKLSKNAVLASTHGTSDRVQLVEEIKEINNKLNIIIPEIGDRHYFDL